MRLPRIGLVLGGGGVIGNAYLTGVLEAIRRVSGWDPCKAEVTVGTSAGSVNGALSALGVPAWFMYEETTGERVDDVDRSGFEGNGGAHLGNRSDREWTDRLFPATGVVPRMLLSSPAAVLRGLIRPWDTPLELFITGLLGEGFISTRTIGEIIEAVQPEGWPDRAFWAVTVNLEAGRRVLFGRDDAPPTDLARAVRASCAIPAFFAPVRVSGQRYVDGGIWSVSNLDVVAGLGLDLVVCVNPMSTLEGRSFEGPVDRITGFVHGIERRAWIRIGRRLDAERKAVEASGTRVLLIQPTTLDLDVIPLNLMSAAERASVAQRALETTTASLQHQVDLRDGVAILESAAAAARAALH
jgi:NTE family protein